MSITKKLTGALLLTIAIMTLGSGTALADEYHDNNQVEVTVDVTATSREGTVFGYRRVTRDFQFEGSEFVGTPSGAVLLAYPDGCAGTYTFSGQAFVSERRDDGAVRVSLLMWTWDGKCGVSGRHGPWAQRYLWIPANETASIDIDLRSSGGALSATATFTNNWAPAEIDLPIGAEPPSDVPPPVVIVDPPVFFDPPIWAYLPGF